MPLPNCSIQEWATRSSPIRFTLVSVLMIRKCHCGLLRCDSSCSKALCNSDPFHTDLPLHQHEPHNHNISIHSILVQSHKLNVKSRHTDYSDLLLLQDTQNSDQKQQLRYYSGVKTLTVSLFMVMFVCFFWTIYPSLFFIHQVQTGRNHSASCHSGHLELYCTVEPTQYQAPPTSFLFSILQKHFMDTINWKFLTTKIDSDEACTCKSIFKSSGNALLFVITCVYFCKFPIVYSRKKKIIPFLLAVQTEVFSNALL